MSITHHPDAMYLSAYVTGQLDLGRHIAVATHLMACPQCQRDVEVFTEVGGVLLDDLPATEMSSGAFASLSALLDASRLVRKQPAPNLSESGLPDFVRRYTTRSWRMVAPGLRMRPIILPEPSPTRTFLLQSAAGVKLREHTHKGVEITCVLHGGFTHEGGHFGPGDFDLGDDTTDHRPVIDRGDDCLCLVAMEGRLRLKGLLGALLSPLIRL